MIEPAFLNPMVPSITVFAQWRYQLFPHGGYRRPVRWQPHLPKNFIPYDIGWIDLF